MRKCLIIILNLGLIIFFSDLVSAQAVSDERQQSTLSALSDARTGAERTDNLTEDKRDVPNAFSNSFYKAKAAENNYWARTNLNINPQVEILNKIAFIFPDGESAFNASPITEPFEIVDFPPPGEFNLRSVKDTNKTFFHKTEYSPGANTNKLKAQFNFKPAMFNLNPDGESKKPEIEDDPNDKTSSPLKEKFHWKPALAQSMILLAIQHSFRMTQPKTRRYVGGQFFADWKNSVKNLRGWDDGNKLFTNYVAHPMQGAGTGRIFINNSDRAKRQEFGKSKTYWESRLKAMLWTAVWSTQFELGPISEASLGNVGLDQPRGRSTLSWCDLVLTPTMGTGWLIGEDAIDKYVLKNWLERNAGYKLTTKIKILRSILTPTMSFMNLLRGKPPWKRDNRTR